MHEPSSMTSTAVGHVCVCVCVHVCVCVCVWCGVCKRKILYHTITGYLGLLWSSSDLQRPH